MQMPQNARASKKDLIENLSMMIEQQKVSYPDIPELITELNLYGFTTGSTGLIRYDAPQGYYDDTVIALALAAWLVRKPKDIRAWSFGPVSRMGGGLRR